MLKAARVITICGIALSFLAPLGGPVYAKKVAKPVTFACIHCKNKITVKAKGDWTKKCAVCKCGLTVNECRPKTK